MLCLESNPETPINLGNPVEYTMLELADEVIFATKNNSQIEFKPLPLDDPKQRCPDISKAQKFLNWEPKVALSVGLARTTSYFREIL
jgi:UDP-glucuronate decarboxylase